MPASTRSIARGTTPETPRREWPKRGGGERPGCSRAGFVAAGLCRAGGRLGVVPRRDGGGSRGAWGGWFRRLLVVGGWRVLVVGWWGAGWRRECLAGLGVW